MEREEFKRQLDQLWHIIVDGVRYFTAWRGLMVEDRTSARGLDRYRDFFVPARQALLKMALLEFDSVFDQDPRTVSFTNLLREATRDRQDLIPNATDDSLREIRTKMRVNKALLKSLNTHRDKLIAHHDRIVPHDASVTYGPFRDLIEDVQYMYNLLSYGHENSRTLFELAARDTQTHTDQLVGIMRGLVQKRSTTGTSVPVDPQ